MYYDMVIMNPPYDKNLHLFILENVIKKGKYIVSLEPCRSFLNFTESTIISKSLMPKLDSMDIISMEEVDILFDIYTTSELGIVYANNTNGKHKGLEYINKDFEDLYYRIKSVKSWRSASKNGDFEYCLPMQGDSGFYKKYKLKPEELLRGNPLAKLVFNDKAELENFRKTLSCWVNNLIYKLDDEAAVPAHLPFMEDEINPRTRLKGYKSEWTDEDFYQFFNVSNKERLLIKELLEK